MKPTRLDLGLAGIALLITLLLIAHQITRDLSLQSQAREVAANITAVAETVSIYYQKTGRWFPDNPNNQRIYDNPFDESAVPYQGLDVTRLHRDANAGMVLQLVRYEPTIDRAFFRHPFRVPLAPGEPFLRVLLDYGSSGQTETLVLLRLQELLPPESLVEIDDHYFIIDIRALINV